MKKCWFNEFFLDSGARAEEMLRVGLKALAKGIFAQELFLVFSPHLLVNSTVSWQVFDLCVKKCRLSEFFLDSGARAEEMLNVGVKALAWTIVSKEQFLLFYHHWLAYSAVSWQVFDFCMKKCSIPWFSQFFLDSGARAGEMLHVGLKALARGIVSQE